MGKTNFEKWKEGLTLEKLTALFEGGCNFCEVIYGTSNYFCGDYDHCPDRIMDWGEQEAQDE